MEEESITGEDESSMTKPDGELTYTVQWMLTQQEGKTADYGKAIRRSWWRSRGGRGERRLACDWLADVVVVTVEIATDDISGALNMSRDQVIGEIERADLPLPESVVVIAAAVER
jgi:hypothetical protein